MVDPPNRKRRWRSEGAARQVRGAPPGAVHRCGAEAASSCRAATSRGRFLPTGDRRHGRGRAPRIRLRSMSKPPDLKDIDKEISKLGQEKDESIAAQDYRRAGFCATRRPSSGRRRKRSRGVARRLEEGEGLVDETSSRRRSAKMTGIPRRAREEGSPSACSRWKTSFTRPSSARTRPSAAIAKAIRRSRAASRIPSGPSGHSFSSGPTGVAKTLMAKALGKFMFARRTRSSRSTCRSTWRSTTCRACWRPSRYVGFEEGGQLTEKIRRRPYAVVLLDEIEKAHGDVYNMLLRS